MSRKRSSARRDPWAPFVMTLSIIIGFTLTGCPAPGPGDGSSTSGSAEPGDEVEPPPDEPEVEPEPEPEPEPDEEELTLGKRIKQAGSDPAALAEVLSEATELFFIAKKGAPAGGDVEAFKAHDAKRDVAYVPVFTEAKRLEEFAGVVGAPRRPVSMVPARALRTVLLVEAAEVIVNAKSDEEARLPRELVVKLVERLGGGD